MCDNSLAPSPCENDASCGISSRFQLLFPSHRQVAHALLTRPPLFREPKLLSPFDLNVLGTPPAFILSQDQTLEKYLSVFRRSSSFRALLPAIYSCTTFVLFPFRNCRDLLPFSFSKKGCCCLICCSIFKDQFRPLLGVAFLVYYFFEGLSTTFFKKNKLFFENRFTHYLLWVKTHICPTSCILSSQQNDKAVLVNRKQQNQNHLLSITHHLSSSINLKVVV